MIFGLIAGLLIFYVAISFLNMTYLVVVNGAGNVSDSAGNTGFATISKVVWIVLYGMYAYMCATGSFKTIGFFSEHAPKWLGVQGPATEKVGDKAMLSQATQLVGSYLGSQAVTGMMRSPLALEGAKKSFDIKNKEVKSPSAPSPKP